MRDSAPCAGHIDEDEQRGIDAAKAELEAMRARKEEAEAAARRIQEQAELQALMVNNDVEAAEKKLAEIIAEAEADGHIDEDEQREIDEAKAQLKVLKAKKALMDKRQKMMQGKALNKGQEEKAKLSAAQKEIAAERLRLATELRELKAAHTKLRGKYTALTEQKKQLAETNAASEEKLAREQQETAALRGQLSEAEGRHTTLAAKHSALEQELVRARAQANARQERIDALQGDLARQREHAEREVALLQGKEQRMAAMATDLQARLTAESERVSGLVRENLQLGQTATLEKQSAQLERAAADKFRVRCVDMEERWTEAEQRAEHLAVENQRLGAELEETEAVRVSPTPCPVSMFVVRGARAARGNPCRAASLPGCALVTRSTRRMCAAPSR